MPDVAMDGVGAINRLLYSASDLMLLGYAYASGPERNKFLATAADLRSLCRRLSEAIVRQYNGHRPLPSENKLDFYRNIKNTSQTALDLMQDHPSLPAAYANEIRQSILAFKESATSFLSAAPDASPEEQNAVMSSLYALCGDCLEGAH